MCRSARHPPHPRHLTPPVHNSLPGSLWEQCLLHEGGALWEAHHEVHVLDGLAASPLNKVVDDCEQQSLESKAGRKGGGGRGGRSEEESMKRVGALQDADLPCSTPSAHTHAEVGRRSRARQIFACTPPPHTHTSLHTREHDGPACQPVLKDVDVCVVGAAHMVCLGHHPGGEDVHEGLLPILVLRYHAWGGKGRGACLFIGTRWLPSGHAAAGASPSLDFINQVHHTVNAQVLRTGVLPHPPTPTLRDKCQPTSRHFLRSATVTPGAILT